MVFNRIYALRKYYCFRCPNKSPRSTGIKLLEEYLGGKLRRLKVIDFGCAPCWRNSKYLTEKYKCYVIRVDAVLETRPDVVAYPTHLPFRDNCVDVFVFSHILMFMNRKEEWLQAIQELKRTTRQILVVEVFKCKGRAKMRPEEKPLEFEFDEVKKLLGRIVKKHEDKHGLGCFIVLV